MLGIKTCLPSLGYNQTKAINIYIFVWLRNINFSSKTINRDT